MHSQLSRFKLIIDSIFPAVKSRAVQLEEHLQEDDVMMPRKRCSELLHSSLGRALIGQQRQDAWVVQIFFIAQLVEH
ncbi:hypothetical protein ACROYT_G014522 [Oculina patagonica]